MSSFSANGSPTCTRRAAWPRSPSSKRGAGQDARPADAVAAGGRAEEHGQRCPAPGAAARADAAPRAARRRHITLTSGLPRVASGRRPARRRPSARRRSCRSRRRRGRRRRTRWRVRRRRVSRTCSASSSAIGRAPMVKMSRRMPPTPVAAPWYGSTALGWLCDSILKATARPSPMLDDARVLARAGEHVAAGAWAGVRSQRRELLYEQCSLHMTLNMASSRSLGARPSGRGWPPSSSSVRPRARWSGVREVGGGHGRLHDRHAAALAQAAARRASAAAAARRPSRAAARAARSGWGIRPQHVAASRRSRRRCRAPSRWGCPPAPRSGRRRRPARLQGVELVVGQEEVALPVGDRQAQRHARRDAPG